MLDVHEVKMLIYLPSFSSRAFNELYPSQLAHMPYLPNVGPRFILVLAFKFTGKINRLVSVCEKLRASKDESDIAATETISSLQSQLTEALAAASSARSSATEAKEEAERAMAAQAKLSDRCLELQAVMEEREAVAAAGSEVEATMGAKISELGVQLKALEEQKGAVSEQLVKAKRKVETLEEVDDVTAIVLSWNASLRMVDNLDTT